MASAQTALGIHLHNKQKRKASATAGMSFVLDREGHKKFLRVATNQELEAENKKLKQELADKTEERGYWYTEAKSYEGKFFATADDTWEMQKDIQQLRDKAEQENCWFRDEAKMEIRQLKDENAKLKASCL